MTEWSISLPWPDSALLGNARSAWRWSSKARHDARQSFATIMARHAVLDAMPFPLCTITLTFRPPDNRRRDLDNLMRACKPYIDALVDSGIIRDDSMKVVRALTAKAGPPANNGQVDINVGWIDTPLP